MKQKIHISKRILSFLVVFSMIASMIVVPEVAMAASIPPTTMADVPAYSNSSADLSYEYLGTTSGDEDIANLYYAPSGGNLADFQWTEGDYVWIGVYLENMDRLQSMFGETGLNSLTISLLCNSNYFDTSSVAADITNAFDFINGYLKPYVVDDGYEEYDITTYPYTEPTRAGRAGTPHYDTGSIQVSDLSSYSSINGWDEFYPVSLTNSDDITDFTDIRQTITYNEDGDQKMFTGDYLTADKTLVAIFPLKMQGTPEEGTKIVEGLFGLASFVINVGVLGEDGAQSYMYSIKSENDAEINLANKFNIVNSVVNLLPTSYDVNFYTDNTYSTLMTSASGDTLGATGIAEGTAVADAGIVEPVAGTDFNTVNTDGNYFSEFKYVDSTGTEQSYADLITISADAAVDGGAEIKVYPAYVPGTDLTFHGNYPDATDPTKTVTVSPADDATIPKSSEPTVGTAGTEDFTVPTGYVFGGWYDNAACTGDPIVFDDTDDNSDNPTLVANLAGTDIYAKWVDAIKVEFVKIKDDTASDNVVETYYIDPNAADKTVSAPASNPTREGYLFDKWCYDADGTATDFVAKGNADATEFTENTTVYATWKKSVKVIYYDTDKTTELKNETIVTGDNFTPPTVNDDTANNKYFNGWKKVDDDTAFDVSQPLSADITSDELKLYVDMKDAYKVEFYTDNTLASLHDTKYSNSVTTTSLGADNMPSNPTQTGKKFAGWKVSGTDAAFTKDTEITADMQVYADWADQLKIEFYEDASATTVYATKYIDPPSGSIGAANMPADPTARTGYRFEGWYIDGTNTKVDGDTTFSASTTVVGKWTQLFKVEFYDTLADAQAGTPVLASETVDSGNKVTASTVPTTSDNDTDKKYFKGWLKTDGTAFDPANDAVTSDLKLYRDWGDYYKVEFYKEATDIAVSTVYATKYVNPNVATTVSELPDNPTKTAYAFNEWRVYADGAVTTTKFDTSTTVSGNMTVVADWTAQITVKFYEDSDDTTPVKTVYLPPTGGQVTTANMPADPADRTGYEFDGWFAEGSSTEFDPTATITTNTDVVGKWTQLFTVNFYDTQANATTNDGTTGILATEDVRDGEKVTPSTVPTVNDNDTDKKYFKGWKTTDGTAFDPTTATITADVNVYQDWGDYYKVEFYTEDTLASDKLHDTLYVNPNVATTVSALPANPTKTGYGFNEWKVYADGAVTTTKFDTSTTVSGNMTVVADWTEKVKISFYPNDGTGDGALGTVIEEYVTPNIAFDGTVPTVSRTGYTLKEWNTASNGSGTSYTNVAAATFTADTTLYAIWTANGPDTATLTFDANLDGVTPNPSSVTVNVNDKVYSSNIPVVTKTDYTFDGWYASPEITDTTPIDFSAGYTVTENKTVYAHWTYIGSDAVIVNFMDGSSQYATVTVAPNTTLGTMMPANPSKTGFAFKEWNTASDGTGTKFESTTSVGTGPTVTVHAQWIEDITINYNANGGDNGPASVTKPAADAYEDPDVTNMAKGDYTFVGWNTEQNGSGTYVAAGDGLTYADVADMFTPDGGTAPTEVTVYAQWAWTPDDNDTIEDIIDGTPVDPDPNGVRVTFDSNSAGATTTVVDANPKYKYPQLGDTIGTDNMPNEPTREKYTFKGWNTAQDGSGVTFTGTTTVDDATLGDALVEIMENDVSTSKYEVTLYAQWEVASDVAEEDKVTITFNKNLDGSGAASDLIKTVTLYKGDALGYDVAAPTNDKYEFIGWYNGERKSDKIDFENATKFTSTTPITADTDYYAQWQMYLLVQVQPNIVDGAEVDYTYTGLEIKPQYKVFQITYPNGDQQPYEIVDEDHPIYEGDFTDSDFKVEYSQGSSVTALKDAGTYTINVSFADDSALQAKGAKFGMTNPTTIEIKPAGLTFKVDPDTQIQKGGDVTLPTVASVEGIQNNEVADTIYSNVYYSWTESDNDNNITDAELATTTTAEDVGLYVWKIELKSSNYIIEKVESSVDGKNVLKYGVTADYPTYTGSKEGQNLVLDVVPNDPSISGVVVESVDNLDENGNPIDPANKNTLGLKKNDYTTDETFDSAEEPTITEYFVKVKDKDAEEVTFTITLTNSDTTTLTSSTDGVTVTKNADGTYTVTAPLTNKGATPNVIQVTTKAGDAEDAPTITYTFNVKQAIDTEIVLEYGNSPYGLIQRMANATSPWTAEKIEAAKEAFNNSAPINKTYGSEYVPDGGETDLQYVATAWRSYVDDDGNMINYDLDPNALFVYQASEFKVPGYKVINDLGEEVENPTVTVSLTIKKQKSAGVSVYTNDDGVEDVTLEPVTGTTDTYSLSGMMVRTDVYTMTYTYEYQNDDGATETVQIERPVIVLGRRGDVVLSTTPTVNNGDVDYLRSNTQLINSGNSLVAYRCMDFVISTTPTINNGDVDYLRSNTQTVNASTDQYYTNLE